MMEKNKYYGLQVKPDKFESGIVIYNSNSFELNELDVQIVKDTEESSYHRTSKHLAQRKEQRMELTYHWEGDVLIPDLELEDGNNYQIGKYGRM